MSATGLRAIENRFYALIRHRAAADVAEAPPVAGGLEGLRDAAYCLVVTYRRDGTPVPTPVWFAMVDGAVVFESDSDCGKVKRLRRDARVRVAPCNPRGRPLGPPVEGVARFLEGDEAEAAERALARKLGWRRRLSQRLRPAAPGSTHVEVRVAPMSPGVSGSL